MNIPINFICFSVVLIPTVHLVEKSSGEIQFRFQIKEFQSFGLDVLIYGDSYNEQLRGVAKSGPVSFVPLNISANSNPPTAAPFSMKYTLNLIQVTDANTFVSTLKYVEKLVRSFINPSSSIFFIATPFKSSFILDILSISNFTFPISSHLYFIELNLKSPEDYVTVCTEYYAIKSRSIIRPVDSLITQQSKFHPAEYSWIHLMQSSARRGNLQNIPIIGVARPNNNYAEYNETLPLRFTGGVIVVQYWYLRDALNFSEGAIISDSVREGPNGTLTGYAVQINSGEADICVSRTEFLLFRMRGPDRIAYLHPFTTSRMKAFFKQPPASSIRDVYRDAFSTNAWGGYCTLWIVLGLSFCIISSINKSMDVHKRVSETLTWMAACVSLQGNSCESWSSVKLIASVGSTLGLFCFNMYSSQLVSLFSTDVTPVRSLGDLIHQGFFIYSDYYFPTSKYRMLAMQDIGMIPKFPEDIRNVDPALKLNELYQSKAAVISIHDGFHSAIESKGYSGSDICKIFATVDISNERMRMAMFVKRGSPLKDLFNVKTLSMIERGVTFREYEAHYKIIEVKCVRNRNFQAPQLGLKDVFSAYIFLGFGALISIVFLIGEELYVKFIRPRFN